MRLFGSEYTLPDQVSVYARHGLEAALMLLTGILLAKLAWAVFAPSPMSAANQMVESQRGLPESGKASFAILTQSDFFETNVQSDVPSSSVPTSLNIKLVGLRWTGESGETSSATLILPDGTHKRFIPGNEVVTGARLESVARDRIFLNVNGRREELRPEPRSSASPKSNAPGGATTPQPQPSRSSTDAASAPARSVSPALLISDVSFQPETRNGIVTGYQLSPLGNGHFQSAGLEAGDVVIRVNGTSVEGLAPDALHTAATSSETLSLDVVRKGAIVRLRISPETGPSQ